MSAKAKMFYLLQINLHYSHGTYVRWNSRTCMKENRSIRGKKVRFVTARSNQMPETYQITDVAPYVRTYFWVTILYKYHDYSWHLTVIITKIKVCRSGYLLSCPMNSDPDGLFFLFIVKWIFKNQIGEVQIQITGLSQVLKGPHSFY